MTLGSMAQLERGGGPRRAAAWKINEQFRRGESGNGYMAEEANGLWANIEGITRRYGICRRSVQNLMRRRILPHVRVGRILRFDVAACDAALKQFEIQNITHRLDRGIPCKQNGVIKEKTE